MKAEGEWKFEEQKHTLVYILTENFLLLSKYKPFYFSVEQLHLNVAGNLVINI